MCGIAGFLGSPDERAIVRMLELLLHRGPDARGHLGNTGATIGQTRLSVIDLERGDPPLTNETGTVCAVLNGEIYNFKDLQKELLEFGHRLNSLCDTEVIAHLGEDAEPVELARSLDGMFAFAVWDDRRRRLILGRDRLGKKPLYYWSKGGSLVFASEIKAILSHPGVRTEVDLSIIPTYLRYGFIPTPYTAFVGIRSLPPGHVLSVMDGELKIEQYWQMRYPGMDSIAVDDRPWEQLVTETRRLMRAAVARRMIADVPIGAFLSGGIDSASVVGLMAEVSDTPPVTFTAGFDDSTHDERTRARLVARHFGTEHHEFVVRPDAVDLADRIMWNFDQPFGDASAIPTYLLSRATRDHVTVALSGDGGDEVFGGYERFIAAKAAPWFARLPRPVRVAAGAGLERVATPQAPKRFRDAKRFVTAAERGLPDGYLAWQGYMTDEDREALAAHGPATGLDAGAVIWNESAGAAVLDRLLHLNAQLYLLDDLLPKVDRMSMAHGLEVRSPLLDVGLFEFAAALPPSAKVRGVTLKRIMRAAMRPLLPDQIFRGPKRGFGIPLDAWFRGALGRYADDMLLSQQARAKELLHAGELARLVDEHRHGVANNGEALWLLLSLEIFLRRRA